jgi:hypothetical protein
MANSSLRQRLYSRAWDTRCRSVDVARVLRPLLTDGSTLLDAGCGEYGLAEFVSVQTVGVDILANGGVAKGYTYVRGSIISLPFAEHSFTVAASVDVLEHLPEHLRPGAVEQLVAVAERAVVIAFPTGNHARQADEDFRDELNKRGEPLPDWLDEHLRQPYPKSEAIVDAINKAAIAQGRKVKVSIFPSEHLGVAKMLRWSAARSKYLYLIANLTAGIALSVLPRPTSGNCYRVIIVAEFEDDRSRG